MKDETKTKEELIKELQQYRKQGIGLEKAEQYIKQLGVDQARRYTPDLIRMDISLPVTDGFKTFDEYISKAIDAAQYEMTIEEVLYG
jgi:DNA-binding response OmpR family regulator